MRILFAFLLTLVLFQASAQKQQWVDSVFQSLTNDERIAQLEAELARQQALRSPD